MRRQDVLPALEAVGAIYVDRHFVYTSGRHGSAYINMDPLLPEAALMLDICRLLGEPFEGGFETVAAPAVGGVVLAEMTALAMSVNEARPQAVWADKTQGGFSFDRSGFSDRLRGRRVLLVEDLLTTGGSLRKVRDAVVLLDGDPIGASVICNRGAVTASDLGVPRLHSIIDVTFESYEAGACPLCLERAPIVLGIGHGSDFRHHNPDYPGGFVDLAPPRN